MAEAAQETIREAVGVFHDRDSFQNAVGDLMSAGFDRSELSLLAGERTIEAKLGHAYRRVQELEDEPSVPRAAYVENHSLAEGKTGVIGDQIAVVILRAHSTRMFPAPRGRPRRRTAGRSVPAHLRSAVRKLDNCRGMRSYSFCERAGTRMEAGRRRSVASPFDDPGRRALPRKAKTNPTVHAFQLVSI